MYLYIPLLAILIDQVLGDPRSKLHPVILIGGMITKLESKLLRITLSPQQKQFNGFLLVFLVLCITYYVTWAVIYLLTLLSPTASFWGSAILLSFAIAPRSLAEAGSEIHNYLLAGDLAQARYKVGWIVGRDTAELTPAEITRATIETIAENIVDGIISPLFYFVIGGVPLAFLYRAVNTLDSMVGYKNEKYFDFGMIAAKVDDAFNYIPARITAILIFIAAFCLGYNARGAITTIKEDAAKHPSPNSGWAEAGVAGALGIRLGGLNYYNGIKSFRAYMGKEVTPLQPQQIKQAIRIMYFVTGLFVLLSTGLLFKLM